MIQALLIVYLFVTIVTWFRPLWWINWDVRWEDIMKRAAEDREANIRLSALPPAKANLLVAFTRFLISFIWPYEILRCCVVWIFR